jgi:hypothetical protein
VAPLDGPADDETQSRLDSFLIDRWNNVVGPGDEVWLLGDACMGRLDPTIGNLRRLLGRIVLVPGNHDRVWVGDHRRQQWWDRTSTPGSTRLSTARPRSSWPTAAPSISTTSRTRATRGTKIATSAEAASRSGSKPRMSELMKTFISPVSADLPTTSTTMDVWLYPMLGESISTGLRPIIPKGDAFHGVAGAACQREVPVR